MIGDKTGQTSEAKAVFLGNAQVGKTCLVNRGVDDVFSDHTKETIGACYSEKLFVFNSQPFKLQLWDTAGQERFKTLVPLYFRNAVVAAIVFSVDSRESFNCVDDWLETLHESKSDIPIIVLVGTKIDLIDDRKVTSEEGENKAKELKLTEYFETSSRTGEGVEAFFNFIGKKAFEHNSSKMQTESIDKGVEINNEKTQSSCC